MPNHNPNQPDSVKVVGFFYIDQMKLYAIAGDTPDDTLYLSKSNPALFVDIIDVCCGQYIEEYQPRQSVTNVRYEWIPNHKRKKDDPRLIDTMDKLPKLSEV